MLTFYRPRIKDQGSHIVSQKAVINSLSNSATNTFCIGAINDKDDTQNFGHTAYVDELITSAIILAASSSAVTLAVKKYDASAAAAVTLASSYDWKGSLTAGKSERIPFDSGVTDQQRIVDFGDTLYCEIVTSGTVTTQPAGEVGALIKFIT